MVETVAMPGKPGFTREARFFIFWEEKIPMERMYPNTVVESGGVWGLRTGRGIV